MKKSGRNIILEYSCVKVMGAVAGVATFIPALAHQADNPPNIVWFMMEDVAPHFMAAYNDGVGAEMPNFGRIASEGLLFENVYSCAPVSSAARSTLITGRYAPRIGVGYHRTAIPVRLPESTGMFPSLLRAAGYHTSNANKTDYNCRLDSAAWDIVYGRLGDWRKRLSPEQPFFFVRTNAACHEGCLHFTDTAAIADSGNPVKLLPQHPSTPLMRKTYLRFYEALNKCDEELGTLIDMLAEDGLLDNTVIFCFGDNGGSLPGSKGYLSEAGLKVPLAVYIPEKWRKKWGYDAGSRIGGIVDFTDFAPTVLNIAGAEIPDWIDGTPFLGDGISVDSVNCLDETYGYADRFDELYVFNRVFRKGRYKYIRHYYPYQPESLMATYRYRQKAFMELREMFVRGELDSIGSRFFMPSMPEALYDLEADPMEVRDLSTDPSYAVILADMRQKFSGRTDQINDVGIIPEYLLEMESDGCPGEFGSLNASRLQRLRRIADMQMCDSPGDFEAEMADLLVSEDEAERYWAATDAIWFVGRLSDDSSRLIVSALASEQSPAIKSKLLTVGILAGHRDISDFVEIMKSARSESELLQIMNDMAYLHDRCGDLVWDDVVAGTLPFDSENIRWRIDYLLGQYNCQQVAR